MNAKVFAASVVRIKNIQLIRTTFLIKLHRPGLLLVGFPFSGENKELNEHYFPKKDYWNVLAAESSTEIIYYADYPQLASIETMDGTHLSGANATRFTDELLKIIDSASK